MYQKNPFLPKAGKRGLSLVVTGRILTTSRKTQGKFWFQIYVIYFLTSKIIHFKKLYSKLSVCMNCNKKSLVFHSVMNVFSVPVQYT